MYEIFISVALIWFFVLFCDTIFKSCMFHPYFRALHATGLDIKPLMVYLRITRYNRFLNRIGLWRSRSFKIWFNIGAIITSLIAVPCLVLYLVSFYQIYSSSTAEEYDSSVLVPVIPGYNFPWSHGIYYLIVIFISSIVHEFGHALAASREGISIENVGCALCVVIPLAFVNLRFDQFRQISWWQQMRIVCAGIWHNIVLSLLAMFCCAFLTTVLAPLYAVGKGVGVIGVHEELGLNHPAAFEIGDQIYGIGHCNINFQEDWRFCLTQLSKNPQEGLCVPDNTNSRSLDACFNSSGYLYFKPAKEKVDHDTEGICLYAREAIQNFSACNKTSDCKMPSTCMFPVFHSKMHRFVAIKRHDKPPVLYVGTLESLYADVQVSRFTQKYKFFPVSYAEAVTTFLEYVVMFSCGLACLNMLPILSFDGEFIIELLIHICFERFIPRYEQRTRIFVYISKITFGLVICLAAVSAYKFYTISF